MNLVTRNHLERWAETALSKSTLPYLISRLVRASTPISTKINIPWGSATYIGGWDGIVNCEIETAYVPQGISLWEFGTSSDCTAKANSDYNKRKNDPIGFEPGNSTFIFITPRLWIKKDEWIRGKKAENHWRNVIAYDSRDLEQWLDRILSVSLWLASQDGFGVYPFEGIVTADEFWEEWSIGPNDLRLFPEIIIAGREHEKKILLSVLLGKPKIVAIKASTKNEAIAFIIAIAKTFQDKEGGQFFSKTLIVNTEEIFRGIVRENSDSTFNIIPKFNETQPFNIAVSRGHHVLVPLGVGDDMNLENTITLPTIDRDGQVDALIKSGILREDAEKLSRESARNITILKKMLKFPQYKAKWYDKENIRDIIPALLLGRWNENFVGDIELIEKLSGQSYADYSAVLNKWRDFEESPIIQIGRTWRLTSPLDSWTNLASRLTRVDFQNLQECFSTAFKNGNPIIEPENKDRPLAYFNNRRKYSDWSREGLVQSLILVGQIRGGSPNIDNPQDWVDNIIFNLLNNAGGEVWISINKELPLIAEASPETFLKAVRKSLEKQAPEVMDMFKEEEDGVFSKKSHHTGLLWALESLAWLPEYLRDTSLVLLKLSVLDPGGNLSNRPINSITEIFKPWHYQTLAPFGFRMDVLKQITENEKALGWSLLIRMLPSHHEIAFPTHKMRWRMFDKNTNLSYVYKEIQDTHSAIIEMLITIFDDSEDRFSQLIKETPNLSLTDRKRVLTWADEVYPNIKHKRNLAWETIRGILSYHRSYPNASWALPETELMRFEILYNKLRPTDIIHKYIWLFNEQWPQLPEGLRYDSKNYEQQLKKVDDIRRIAVEEWLKNLNLEAVIELRNKVKDCRTFGKILAQIVTTREDILLVCQCLRDRSGQVSFIHGFLNEKSTANGINWIKTIFKELKKLRLDDKSLSNIFIPLNQNQQLWDFIASLSGAIQDEYWKNIYPHLPYLTNDEKVYGIKMLLNYKRFFSAIVNASLFPNEIPSELLVDILKKAAVEKANENSHFADYEIEQIFEELDKRTDIERSTLLDLECLYLPILSRNTRGPKMLEEELVNNPHFFVDILKLIYKPKDKKTLEKEQKKLSSRQIQNGAERAHHLLRNWKRIPGMRDDNSIDKNELSNWIQKVRLLAESVGRLEVADEEIGQVLARYPEDCQSWPEEKIFQMIEDINTDDLKEGYHLGLVNKRSFSTRGVFDGGNIERERALYFEKLENDFRSKYANVSEIFKYIKNNYLAEAKRMDEEADRFRLEC